MGILPMLRPIFDRGMLPILLVIAVAVFGCGKNHESVGEALPPVSVRIQTIDKKPHIATEEDVASLLISRMAVPVLYYAAYRKTNGPQS
jgi:hypothetical protein